MTWPTKTGVRHLTGAEARLFQAALKKVLEKLEADQLDCSYTLLELDSSRSVMHLLAYVARYLLQPTHDLAPLNAWTEGAIGVIFDLLANNLELELESENGPNSRYWRDRIFAAAKEKGWKRPSGIGCAGSPLVRELVDPGYWHHMMLFLEEQVLWDTGWAVDAFSPLAADPPDDSESYFDWRHISTLDSQELVKTLWDLCGYVPGRFDEI